MKRGSIVCVLAVLLAWGAAARPTASEPEKTFTFGAMLPLTGFASDIGEQTLRGIDLAIDQINAKGIDGWKLQVISVDHKGSAQGGITAINQLVNLNHVPFVISTFTGVTLASQPIAAQNNVLLLNVGGSSSALLDKPWLYNNQVMSGPLNEPLARYMHDQGLHTAALLTSEDAYGKDDGNAFTKAWAALGGTIVDSETYPLSATDFTPQLLKIRGANPQVLYIVALGETEGLLFKQARALGLNARIVGPLASGVSIKVAGSAAEGFISSGIAVDDSTPDRAARGFLDGYKKKYGIYPDWEIGTAYEAVYMLAALIHEVVHEKGDPQNGAALVKALESHPAFHNYLTGGEVRLLPDHGAIRSLAVQQVRGGRFVTLKVVQPTH